MEKIYQQIKIEKNQGRVCSLFKFERRQNLFPKRCIEEYKSMNRRDLISKLMHHPLIMPCYSRSRSVDRVNTVQLLPRKLTSNASAPSFHPRRWVSLLSTPIKAPRALGVDVAGCERARAQRCTHTGAQTYTYRRTEMQHTHGLAYLPRID